MKRTSLELNMTLILKKNIIYLYYKLSLLNILIQMYMRFEPSIFPPNYNKFKFEMSVLH